MALKFRRGTTAQQSGSLAFGEPYVNTTLGTLLIGGPTGDIVLSTTGTGSTGTFGAISGSGLDITGNANIAGNLTLGGNITIGNATTDTVVINADLSSSIIPDITNVFDIGSPTKVYKNVYANNISASLVEIMSGSNPELRLNNKTTGIAYHIQNGDNGSLTIHNPTGGGVAIAFLSSSTHANVLLYADLGVSQSVTANRLVANTISGSFSGSVNGIGNVTTYSSSVATRLTALEVETSNLETFSGSQLGKDATLATLTASYDGRFTTLGTYTASVEGRFSTLATLTGSNATRLTNLESTTASLNTSVSNLNTFSSSTLTRLTALEVETSNLETFSGSQLGKDATLATYTGSVEGRFATLATLTGSNGTRLTALEVSASTALSTNNTQATSITNLNSTTASLNTSVTNLNTFSASENGKAATLATYTGSNDTKWSTLGSLSGSFARTNSNNTFSGLQTFNNINVDGTASFAYIQSTTGSSTSIGEQFIILNTSTPASNFAGIKVVDSGSTFATASFVYDGLNNNWVFEKALTGSSDTSVAIFGPISTGGLGTEVGLTQNKLPKAVSSHGHHIADSQISDDGTTVSIGGALTVTGNITGPIRATNGVVSGSSQITYSGLSGIPAGIVSSSSQITSILPAGVVSGSSQVIGILSSLNTYTGSNDTTNTTQNTRLTALETSASTALSTNNTQATSITNLNTLTASALTRLTALEVETANLETYTSSFAAASVALTNKTISGASNTLSNIANASLTNSSITIAGTSTALGSSITAATILQGTGVVSGSSQITAGSTTNFATDVKTQLNSNTVVSGSGQINVASTTGDIALGTRTSGNYVASMTAGTGITVGTATGEGSTPVITNTGVTSNAAGTGVSVSAGTGAVTISIGQSVATSASPTFAGLTINGAITATGDITAFFTSDKRHKNNIQIIPNALEKVSKLNGVTWEWNDDVNEVTKQSPKTGLIAQEVLEVLPEVVKQKEDGFLGLDYSKMMGLLVEAIKEQQSQIEELKSKLGYN